MFWNKTPSPCSRGVRGSHCVKQRVLNRLSYQPPCRVLLRKKRGWGGGGARTPQNPSPQLFLYTHDASVWEIWKNTKEGWDGGGREGGRLWWIIVTSKPDRKYLYLLSAMENGKGTEVMWVHRIGLYLAFFFLPLPLPPPLWKVDNPFPWISLHPYGKCHYSARRLI